MEKIAVCKVTEFVYEDGNLIKTNHFLSEGSAKTACENNFNNLVYMYSSNYADIRDIVKECRYDNFYKLSWYKKESSDRKYVRLFETLAEFHMDSEGHVDQAYLMYWKE